MTEPMICACGKAMNHHADKIIYTDNGEELNQFHECPDCGASASRTAQMPSTLEPKD